VAKPAPLPGTTTTAELKEWFPFFFSFPVLTNKIDVSCQNADACNGDTTEAILRSGWPKSAESSLRLHIETSNFGTEYAFVFETMKKSVHKRAWWLEEGTEVCPACGQTYAFQTEWRCDFCDGVVCYTCAAWTQTEICCPSCRTSNLEVES
jgi:hypothetical protein